MTRRYLYRLAVVVVAVLVAVAQPAAASHNPVVIDDFEDGDLQTGLNGWTDWRDTGNFSAENTALLGGSYAGNLTVVDSTDTWYGPRVKDVGDDARPEWVNFTVRIDQGGNFDRKVHVDLVNNDGNQIGAVLFRSRETIAWETGNTRTEIKGSWSPDTNYRISVRLSRANNGVDIYVNGTKKLSATRYGGADNSNLGQIRFEVEHTSGGQTTTAWIDDIETRDYHNAPPSLDDGSASPTGGGITSANYLKIDASDPDFQYPDGFDEEVTVDFYVDGNLHGTDTVTSNGTAQVPIKSTGGSHDWYAVATDTAGDSDTSNTFSYKHPATLYIRNETNSSELVDNVEVTVRFYPEGTGDVYVRNTTDGTVDMRGLPSDEWLIATASADGWFDRRIALQSLLTQQDIYLVNDSATVVESIFDYQDFTGRFPPDETIVQIQTPINGSWQTVEGDVVGATGEIPAHLRYNVRHRINVTNVVTGEEIAVGAYIPTTSGVKDLRIHSLDEVEITSPVSVAFEPDVNSVQARNRSFRARFHSEDDELASYNLTVRIENQSGTYVLGTQSGSAAGGETLEVPVNLSGEAESSVNVSANYTTTGGGQATLDREYTVTEYFVNDHSLLNILASKVPGRTTSGFLTLFAGLSSVLLTAAIGSKLRMSTEGYGLVLTGFVAGWVIVGWLGIAALFAAGATWTVAAALKAGI